MGKRFFTGVALILVLAAIAAVYALAQLSPKPEVKELSYMCEQGKTPFEMFSKNRIDMKFKDSTFGKFVTNINGVEQGKGKFWLYKIDNQEATVSAGSYICKGGEEIKWELK